MVVEKVNDEADSGVVPMEAFELEDPPDIPGVVFVHVVEDEGREVNQKAVVELQEVVALQGSSPGP